MFKADSQRGFAIRLEAEGSAPNARPKLVIYDCKKDPNQEKPVAEVILTDFMGAAQWFAEGEAKHNYQWTGSKFTSYVKRVRKALGFSYP